MTWGTTVTTHTWTCVDYPASRFQTTMVHGTAGLGVTVHGDLTGRTVTAQHPGTAISLTAPPGTGNLATSVVNAQLLADAVDALSLGGGGGSAPTLLAFGAAGISAASAFADKGDGQYFYAQAGGTDVTGLYTKSGATVTFDATQPAINDEVFCTTFTSYSPARTTQAARFQRIDDTGTASDWAGLSGPEMESAWKLSSRFNRSIVAVADAASPSVGTLTTLTVLPSGLISHNLIVTPANLTAERAAIVAPASSDLLVGQEIIIIGEIPEDGHTSYGPSFGYPKDEAGFLILDAAADPGVYDFTAVNRTVTLTIDGTAHTLTLDSDLVDFAGFNAALFGWILSLPCSFIQDYASPITGYNIFHDFALVSPTRGAGSAVVASSGGGWFAAFDAMVDHAGADDVMHGPSDIGAGLGDMVLAGDPFTHLWTDDEPNRMHHVCRLIWDGTDWHYTHRKMRPEEMSLSVETVGDWPEVPYNVAKALNLLAARTKDLEDAPGGGGSGDVVGPASAVDGRPVLFDGATGKLVKQHGSALGTAAASAATDFATASHDHSGVYSPVGHDHSGVYDPAGTALARTFGVTKGAGSAVADTTTVTTLLPSIVDLPALASTEAFAFQALISYINSSGSGRIPIFTVWVGATQVLTLTPASIASSGTARLMWVTGQIYATGTGTLSAGASLFSPVAFAVAEGTATEAINVAGVDLDIRVQHASTNTLQSATLKSFIGHKVMA